MTYKVIFHPKVAIDLQMIAETIAGHAGTTEATRKLLQMQETAIGLTNGPEESAARRGSGDAVRIAPVGRKGAIIFEVDNNTRTVFVLAIAYGGTAWVSQVNDRNEC